MNKGLIVEAIIAALASELESYARSARAAHAEATDEQSKAENKYDTRGLEASYLARGQSRQARETIQALEQYRALSIRPFAKEEAIDIGAVVEVSGAGESSHYFIGPKAGGVEVVCAGVRIMVITPQSPLGQQFIGRKRGDPTPSLSRERARGRIVAIY